MDQQDDEQQNQSDQPQEEPSESERGERTDDKGAVNMNAPVPGRDKNQRAEEFRQRVLKGLARDKGGRLGPAVKRYAEGLLK